MAYLRKGIGDISTDQAIDIVGSASPPASVAGMSLGKLAAIAAVGFIGYAVLVNPDAMNDVAKIWRK